MSVTHLKAVSNFMVCLDVGGEHRFEITLDEMPALETMLGLDHGVVMPCTRTDGAATRTIWSGIVDRLADRKATCRYKRIDVHRYEVTCVIPPP